MRRLRPAGVRVRFRLFRACGWTSRDACLQAWRPIGRALGIGTALAIVGWLWLIVLLTV